MSIARPEHASRAVLVRSMRWLVPATIAAIAAYWTVGAAYRCTFATLGRDPGIFQYVAWALEHGERDYVDFREINGPLPHFIHLVFLHLGGADEHVFRVLDVLSEALVFAAFGAVLPGIGVRGGAPARVGWGTRAAWAAATSAVLTAQYLVHGWWQTAQRESFYDLFIVASMAVQLWAQRGPGRERLFAGVGALGALTWFGKPTNLAFTALQAAALLADDRDATNKRRALAWLVGGCGAAAVVIIALTFAVGDPIAGARIVFGEVPRLYRWIWKLSLSDCYSIWNNAPKLNYAFATLAGAAVLTAMKVLPREMLVVAPLLVGGLVNFFLQGKGFPYHLHPITLGTHAIWVAAMACVTDRVAAAEAGPAESWRIVATACGAAVLGLQSADEARLSEYWSSDWAQVGATPEARASRAYFDRFPWGDYFAGDLRDAARYIDANTSPDDRVQTYGVDPYLLFLAQRRSATPFIYSFELNVDSALRGGSGGAPDGAERAWLLDRARKNGEALLAALEKRPPAAFALIDMAPFTHPPDAVLDFAQHCPRASEWMRERYEETARFGAVHVWLRADRKESAR